MRLEEGSIIEGKITGIQKFGAFVDLGGGKSGMIHISEVSPSYVNDINEFLKVGQTVKAKVITIGENGKISLSIKKALPPEEQQPARRPDSAQRDKSRGYNHDKVYDKDAQAQQRPKHFAQKKPAVKKEEPDASALQYAQYAYEPRNTSTDAEFEDMLSKFKSSSEDRMSDLKRTMDFKKRGSRRK